MKPWLQLALWLALLPAVGCSSMMRSPFSRDRGDQLDEELPPEEREKGLLGGIGKDFRKSIGLDKVDKDAARREYQAADAIFKEATQLSQNDPKRPKKFKAAAAQYKKAAKKWRESALEQDAIFMAAESMFFADELPEAEDLYSQLIKEHPRNRHVDKIQARKFMIARYWVDVGKERKYSFFRPNFFDKTLPWTDARGHGVRVYDKMRFDDPTGRLADDATMAGAVEYFEQEKFEDADQWFMDLIQTFPDSPHQYKAHILALRSKLNTYRGPSYTADPLLDSQKLLDKMARTFRQQIESEPEMSKTLAEANAEVKYRLAERLVYFANYYEKRGEYGPARWCYEQLQEKYSDTPLLDKAREGIARSKQYPDMPPQRLAWLASMFPDEEEQKPLIGPSNSDKSLLR